MKKVTIKPEYYGVVFLYIDELDELKITPIKNEAEYDILDQYSAKITEFDVLTMVCFNHDEELEWFDEYFVEGLEEMGELEEWLEGDIGKYFEIKN